VDKLEVHHDLALMLLVGRSLSTGIPWTLDEDQSFIAQERILWNALSPEDQQWEQTFLASLHKQSPEERFVPVNPEWGDWTEELPSQILITDDAFGLPKNAYLPNPKGEFPAEAFPEFQRVFKWMWEKGFQVVDVMSASAFAMSVPTHRIVQEAERLVALLAKDFPELSVNPYGHFEGGVQLRSCYDPIKQTAVIEVFFLTDESLPQPTTGPVETS